MKKSNLHEILFVSVLLVFSAVAGITVFFYNGHNASSFGQNALTQSGIHSSVQPGVQGVTLLVYDAPAITGSVQSNGTRLYIPPQAEGNLMFGVVLPPPMQANNTLVSVFLDGKSVLDCQSVVTSGRTSNIVKEFGCQTIATQAGSNHNVTLVITSPQISTNDGVYSFQSMVPTILSTA